VSSLVEALCYNMEGRFSTPNGAIKTFHWFNPFSHTKVLQSIQSLTEMSTWGVKAVSAQGWQSCHSHVPIFWKSGSLKHLENWRPVDVSIHILFLYLAIQSRWSQKLILTYLSEIHKDKRQNFAIIYELKDTESYTDTIA
jgi:hypothetical protein